MSKPTTRTLVSPYHYIFMQVSPPTEHIALRYAIQKALQQTFGITRAGLAVDILSEQGEKFGKENDDLVVLRVASEDAEYVLSALPTWNNPSMRVVRETPFLASDNPMGNDLMD
ncbi:hypothetical protein FRC12_013915 [Ceratobasidium sp. 428]|nr:hypothetical protein FRC12_013915 [Ceratobasidium sp. 428]